MEISNLAETDFKMLVIMMLTELGRRLDEHRENLNRDRKYK